MKKTTLLASIATLGMLFGTYSCKKEGGQVTETPSPSTSQIDDFFTDNQSSMTESISMNSSVYNEVIASKGTKLSVPANSFVDQSGTPVTGNIVVEIIEVLTAADMVLVNIPSTAGGDLLVSGGELKIQAFQNGTELKLAPGASINVKVPAPTSDANMEVFVPVLNGAGEFSDWISAGAAGMADSTIIVVQDTSGQGGDYYNFDFSSTNLGWINCDYYNNDPSPKTTVNVNVVSPYDNTNTSIFLHIPAINSLAPFSDWNNDGTFESYTTSIPIGTVSTIIVISEINGQFYSEFIPVTIVNNHVENASPTLTTQAQILIDLGNL